jgi:hypothetical protein
MRQGSPGHGEDFAAVEFVFDARACLYRKVIVFTVMPLGMLEHDALLSGSKQDAVPCTLTVATKAGKFNLLPLQFPQLSRIQHEPRQYRITAHRGWVVECLHRLAWAVDVDSLLQGINKPP